MRQEIQYVLVFLLFAIIFSVLQFTVPHIIGFDGYYHIKSAEIIKEQGFIHEFPWTTESILADRYADIQLLFRIFLIPFTFFNLEIGAKIAAILMTAIMLTTFYWYLSKKNILYPLFWTVLFAFATTSLTFRFMFTRPLQIAITLLILTLWLLEKKKYWQLGAVSVLYAWWYGGFIIQLFVVAVYILIGGIVQKKWDTKSLLFTVAGTAIGLIVHPNVPNNILLLYTQIFDVNLSANTFNVEWMAWSFTDFLLFNIIPLLLLFGVIAISIHLRSITRNQIFFLIATLFFLGYTVLTRRMQEYFVPFAIILFALLLTRTMQSQKVILSKIVKGAGIVVLLGIAGTTFFITQNDIRNNDFLFRFTPCTDWMNTNVEPASAIFTNAYAFPYLFFQTTDLYYTHGIDLTYAQLHDPEKFSRYMDILQGTHTSPVNYIIQDYAPAYVFVGKIQQDVEIFNYVVNYKDDFSVMYEDEWCAVLAAEVL